MIPVLTSQLSISSDVHSRGGITTGGKETFSGASYFQLHQSPFPNAMVFTRSHYLPNANSHNRHFMLCKRREGILYKMVMV